MHLPSLALFALTTLAACGGSEPATAPATDAGAGQMEAAKVYACPMHPEQTSHEPGQCPVCGMDMVLTDATGEAGGHAN